MKFRDAIIGLFLVFVLSYVIFWVLSDIYNADYGIWVAIAFLVAATATLAASVKRRNR